MSVSSAVSRPVGVDQKYYDKLAKVERFAYTDAAKKRNAPESPYYTWNLIGNGTFMFTSLLMLIEKTGYLHTKKGNEVLLWIQFGTHAFVFLYAGILGFANPPPAKQSKEDCEISWARRTQGLLVCNIFNNIAFNLFVFFWATFWGAGSPSAPGAPAGTPPPPSPPAPPELGSSVYNDENLLWMYATFMAMLIPMTAWFLMNYTTDRGRKNCGDNASLLV